jgi:hypothetical protein
LLKWYNKFRRPIFYNLLPRCAFIIKMSGTDEDIPTVDTTAATTPPHVPGPLTRARARQLNYQVLSFLGTLSNTHENMMLPKSDVFMLLRNNGPSMDKDNQWIMMMHEDDVKLARIEDDAARVDFRTLKTS